MKISKELREVLYVLTFGKFYRFGDKHAELMEKHIGESAYEYANTIATNGERMKSICGSLREELSAV